MGDSDNKKQMEAKLSKSISLAKRAFSVVDEPVSFLEERLEVEKRVNQLSYILKTLLGFIKNSAKESLYLRPVERVLEEVEVVLELTIDIICKLNFKSVFYRFFNITKTTDFKTLYRQLDDSIANMKWLLIVYDPIDNGALGEIFVYLPPIVNSNPFFLPVWHCIFTLQMGRQLSVRIDAMQCLASLAQNNELYKKYIVEEGGLPPLSKLLKENDCFDAQIAAANALCILTNDSEIMRSIVIVIVRLLKDAPIEVQIKAATLVAEMVELNAEPECDSTEGNVIWPLVNLLASEINADDDPEINKQKLQLKVHCAEALWILAAWNVSNCNTIANTKAMLSLAKLVENQRGKLQYYCLMTIMEITAVAESDIQFRCSVFKTNSPSTKAVVNQLLRVIKESNDPIQLTPAIRSIGSLARIFPSGQTRIISPLVSLLDNRHLTVATEAAIALHKFTSPENFLWFEHWKSVFEFISFPTLIRFIGDGNKMQRHRSSTQVIRYLFYIYQHLRGCHWLSNKPAQNLSDKKSVLLDDSFFQNAIINSVLFCTVL